MLQCLFPCMFRSLLCCCCHPSPHVRLAVRTRRLVRLNMSHCSSLRDDALRALNQLPTVTELDISHCDNVTAEGLINLLGRPKPDLLDPNPLLSNFTNVTNLNIDGCKDFAESTAFNHLRRLSKTLKKVRCCCRSAPSTSALPLLFVVGLLLCVVSFVCSQCLRFP